MFFKINLMIWLQAIRPQFFSVIILPISLGMAIAWQHTGSMHWDYGMLFLLAALLSQAAANVINDYFDDLNQTDVLNQQPLTPFAGGSRIIQRGQLSARAMYYYGLILMSLALVIGFYLFWVHGVVLLVIALTGILSGFFYSAPPLVLSHRGLGELLVGVNFGILAPLGAYYVQTGLITFEVITAALPLACLATAILVINEFPDVIADQRVGKKNLVVRLGTAHARFLYGFLIVLSFVSLLVGVAYDQVAVLSLLLLPWAGLAIQKVVQYHQQPLALIPAIKITLSLYILMSGLVIFSIIFKSI
ncbi:MAG: prenyltransferase [Pseudomonadota bacterium]|nr:prenyltransferase [Pseudomonadota bacterium]